MQMQTDKINPCTQRRKFHAHDLYEQGVNPLRGGRQEFSPLPKLGSGILVTVSSSLPR